MSTDVMVRPAAAVATAEPAHGFTREQVELLKATVCKGATDDELALFREVCRQKRLDPFTRQIHAVKRWDNSQKREVMSFQTGIDGFRLVAERTNRYAGQDAPMWCGEDGEWRDVWLSQKPPAAARATVYKAGFEKPLTRIALYREYVQTNREGNPTSMWAKMPAAQLHKCAEALALRAAFPEELSGLYTNEEMGQADNSPAPVAVAQPTAPVVAIESGPRTKPWKTRSEMIKCFAGIKQQFAPYTKVYYDVLREFGVEHCNQFSSSNDAVRCWQKLNETLEMKPGAAAEQEPPAETEEQQ